jgi:ABC-type Fe3+/spermidine/putrescine transport system ATPase subunit
LNRAKGVVAEVVYVGDATRYRVTLGASGTVTVKIQNRMVSRPYAVGDPIELLWDPRQTRLFRGGP